MVNITGLSKAKVLKALYDNSHMQGMSFLAAPSRPITLKDCEEALKHNTYFDYFYGRVIKVDLSGNKFDDGEELFEDYIVKFDIGIISYIQRYVWAPTSDIVRKLLGRNMDL